MATDYSLLFDDEERPKTTPSKYDALFVPDTSDVEQVKAKTIEVAPSTNPKIEELRNLLDRARGVSGGIGPMVASAYEAAIKTPERVGNVANKFFDELGQDPQAALMNAGRTPLGVVFDEFADEYNKQRKMRQMEAERFASANKLASVANDMLGYLTGAGAAEQALIGQGVKAIPGLSRIPNLASKVISPGIEGGVTQALAEGANDPNANMSKEFAAGALANIAGQQTTKAAVPYAQLAAGKTLEKLGQGGRSIANVYDHIALKVGQVVNDKFPTVGESFLGNKLTGSSKLVDKLKDVATMSIENASRGYDMALKTLGGLQNKDILKIWNNPEERQILLQSLQDSYRYRGQDAYMVDMGKLEDIVSNALSKNRTIANQSAKDFVKSSIKNTVEQNLNTTQNLFRNDPNFQYSDLKPLQRELYDFNNRMLDVIEKGDAGKNLGDFGESAIGEFGKGQIRIPLVSSEKAMVTDILPSGDGQMSYEAANEALRNLTVGKNLLRAGGITSAKMLNPIGIAPFAAEGMEYAGKFAEKKGSEMASNAMKAISNPQVMQELSQQSGNLGMIANGVLEDMMQGKPIQQASKAYLLSMNPEFRRLFLGQNQGQDKQAPRQVSIR